jgi:predicted oxidoreductase
MMDDGVGSNPIGPWFTRRQFLAQATAVSATAAIHSQATAESSAASSALGTPMKTYRIPNTDLTVSRIGYGCNQLVFKDQDPYAPDILAKATGLVRTAQDQGITIFDMAAMYSDGKVETVFGEILKRSPGLRREVIIQTKCGAVDNPQWRQPGDQAFRFDCSRQGILESVEGSLKRLGTDRIDILLLHWPDILLQPEEVAQAFDTLHGAGKVRYFGVSNHTPGQIALLKKYLRQPLVANQIYLGLADSYPIAAGIEQLKDWGSPLPSGHASLAGVLDYCRLNDVQVQAYQPVGGVINKYNLLNPPADASPQVKAASQLLLEMAKQKNTSPVALALAWLLHHPANILAFTLHSALLGSDFPAIIFRA